MLHPSIQMALAENGYSLEKHFDEMVKCTNRYPRHAEKKSDFLFDVTSFIAWSEVCDILLLNYNLITQPIPINLSDKPALKEFGKYAKSFLVKEKGLVRTDSSSFFFMQRMHGDKFAGLSRGITGRNIPIIPEELWEDEFWSTFSSARFFIEQIDTQGQFAWMTYVNDKRIDNGMETTQEMEDFLVLLINGLKEKSIIPHHPHYVETRKEGLLNFSIMLQQTVDGKVSLFDSRMIIDPETINETVKLIKEGKY